MILSACGGKLADTGQNLDESSPQLKEDIQSSQESESLDVYDLSNYFAVIDGEKVYLPDGCSLQDLMDKGFTVKEEVNLDDEVPYGVYSTIAMRPYVEIFKPGVEKAYFSAYVHNPEHAKIPLRDCKMYGLSSFNPEAAITILGGIKLTDGQARFKEVLGTGKEEKVPGYKDSFLVSFPTTDGYGQIAYTYRKEDGKVKDMLVTYISPDM